MRHSIAMIVAALGFFSVLDRCFAEDAVADRAIAAGKVIRDKQMAEYVFKLACETAKQKAVEVSRPKKGAKLGFKTIEPVNPGDVPSYVFTCSKASEKKEELGNAEARIRGINFSIENLRKVEYVLPTLRCNGLKVGDVGVVTYDGKNAVSAKAVQVVDDNNVIMEWSGTPHWVVMPTGGIVDGNTYTLDRPVLVAGTRRYKTVIGAQRTVLEIHVSQTDL